MKIDFGQFTIETRHIPSTGHVAVLLFHEIVLITLTQPHVTKPQALRTGVQKFKEILADTVSASEGIPCTLKQKTQTAIQLLDGDWLIGTTVYSDKRAKQLFNLGKRHEN